MPDVFYRVLKKMMMMMSRGRPPSPPPPSKLSWMKRKKCQNEEKPAGQVKQPTPPHPPPLSRSSGSATIESIQMKKKTEISLTDTQTYKISLW